MRNALTFLLLLVQIACFSQDIVITGINGPTTAVRYTKLPNEIVVKNSGIVNITKSFYIEAYLSEDNILNKGTDIMISTTFVPSLNVNQSFNSKISDFSIYYYSQVQPKTYYLIIEADTYKSVTETDETNNVFIQADYVITAADVNFAFDSFSLDKTTYTANDIIKPSFALLNTGATPVAGVLYTDFYLSSDDSYSSDDIRLESHYNILNGQTTYANEASFVLTLPSVTAGQYHILAITDKTNSVSYYVETDESDNIASQSITVNPASIDLEIISVNAMHMPLNQTNFNFTVKNNGTTGVSGFSVAVLLEDINHQHFEAKFDNYNFQGMPGYIAPGESKSFLVPLADYGFYPPLVSGVYSYNLIINQFYSIVETNYQNNMILGFGSIIVEPPTYPAANLVDFKVTGVYDNSDRALSFNLTLQNTGTSPYFNEYYTLNIRNAANTIVHSQQFLATMSGLGQTTTYSIDVSLTNPLPVGLYKVEVQDEGYITTPRSKVIDLPVQQVQYQLTGTVVGEDGTSITKGNLFLYEKGDNGLVTFVQKSTLTTNNTFVFQLDDHEHTLYFVPDGSDFDTYVPTVYGKTVLLDPSSFFTASSNMNLVFDILKVQPLGSGTGIISGSITSPSGRASTGTLGDLLTSYPVILLSSANKVVGYTHTDGGFYEFKNLPRDTYKLVVSAELDKAVMTTPYVVDISSKNADVDITLGASGAVLKTKQLFLDQTISLTLPLSTTYGIGNIDIVASSDANLPVTVNSSDPTIVEVVGNSLIVKKPGIVIITALQPGDDFYSPSEIAHSLTVTKASQQVMFEELPVKKYGDKSFTVELSSSTKLPVTLISSNPAIASILGNEISIHKAGDVKITASQTGNDFYESVTVVRDLHIAKADQVISFGPLPEKTNADVEFELVAISTSFLDVAFVSDNEKVISIDNNVAFVRGAGKATITASQPGNENYNPALTISREIIVKEIITSVEKGQQVLKVYPNPIKDIVTLENLYGVSKVEIIDSYGRIRSNIICNQNQIDMADFNSGVYALKLFLGNGVQIIRIVKE